MFLIADLKTDADQRVAVMNVLAQAVQDRIAWLLCQ